MSSALTIERIVHFDRRGHGARKELHAGPEPVPPAPSGRVPRVARLLALAHCCDALIRAGVVKDYAALSRLGHVSRARISQILNLLHLAPDLQEALLFLPRAERGRDPLHLAQLQPIAAALEWREQRRLWRELTRAHGLTLDA